MIIAAIMGWLYGMLFMWGYRTNREWPKYIAVVLAAIHILWYAVLFLQIWTDNPHAIQNSAVWWFFLFNPAIILIVFIVVYKRGKDRLVKDTLPKAVETQQ